MEAIKLTEEQKSKLLEMCIKLFDDNQFYTEFRFMPELKVGFLNKETINTDFIQWINQTNSKSISIHWFEFCIEYLSKKVFTINNQIMSGYDYFINNMRYTKKHPVDYLYEKFKELTPNET